MSSSRSRVERDALSCCKMVFDRRQIGPGVFVALARAFTTITEMIRLSFYAHD